jgi:hypothetical protein
LKLVPSESSLPIPSQTPSSQQHQFLAHLQTTMEPSLKFVPALPSLHIPAKPLSLRYHWPQQPSADLQCSPLPRLLLM